MRLTAFVRSILNTSSNSDVAFGYSSRSTTTPSLSRVLLRGNAIGRLLEVGPMLWTLFVILLVLWLVGVVSSYTLGGFIHLLLVLALVALVFQLLTGRRTAL